MHNMKALSLSVHKFKSRSKLEVNDMESKYLVQKERGVLPQGISMCNI